MPKIQSIFAAIPMVIGAVIVTELFFYVQVNHYVQAVKGTALKAFAVLSTSKISDHWKEKILPYYAAKILAATIKVFYCLGLLVVSFCVVYGLIGLVVFESLPEGLENLYRLDMQIIVIAISMIYGLFRIRLTYG
ncbi:hypothetical protein [Candidatus Nitronereus thalassa]|uniref:Uncharacterized protein n=1 Tax=Candidatus Nitronereus thalassa TaxID=3020898 RepID=A0ABU3K3L4_9BACT|nr:hypothetical protein [Candidatus Nitronereus thalassa]MDT7040984.1 hypothetical protein [Candidatus Nitronereus thalassa]